MQTIIDGEYKITTMPNGTVIREINSAPPAPEPVTKMTHLSFRERFTDAEKRMIYTAAKSDVDIEIYLDDLKAAECADVENLKLIAGVEKMQAAGILTPERAAAILGDPITAAEAF